MAIILSSNTGNITAGGDNTDGDLLLNANDGTRRMHLDAGGGNAFFGGNGADGDLVLMPAGATSQSASAGTIHMSGDSGNYRAGGNGADGDITLQSSTGQDRIRLDAGGGNMWIGGNGADGDIVVFASTGDNATLAQATIHINGDAGDIVMQNADFAEDFDIAAAVAADAGPGDVMVLDDEGTLVPCREGYDQRAVGIISGAGDYRPGIVMDKRREAENRLPVALVGKVYAKVDASYGAVRVGDLLTTSPTPGHAMVALDRSLAFGATLGKALGALDEGTGMVPVLVNLQ